MMVSALCRNAMNATHAVRGSIEESTDYDAIDLANTDSDTAGGQGAIAAATEVSA